jgi:hypothetical protein
MARPSDYTQEIADKICSELAEGNSLRTVCEMEDMPSRQTVFSWIRQHKEFLDQYARATEERADAHNELLLELGDEAIKLSQTVDFKASNAVVSAVKLKADNLKWSMSKMKPKKYGDKIDHTTNGKDLPAPIYGGTTTINP